MYAFVGHTSHELLSFRGRMVLHHSREEMEYLFPLTQVVRLNGDSLEEVAHRYGRPVMRLSDHPDMAAVEWPLDRRKFL